MNLIITKWTNPSFILEKKSHLKSHEFLAVWEIGTNFSSLHDLWVGDTAGNCDVWIIELLAGIWLKMQTKKAYMGTHFCKNK